jgi:hypothetical protein
MVLTTLQGDSINYENVTNHSFLGKFIIADEDPGWSNATFWKKKQFVVIYWLSLSRRMAVLIPLSDRV